ncbi:MAG: hypothetical protein M3R15_24790 [Acidobacteriota bacterium]|nr:hypothetical protein [Acidobacteriota bacterium]
MPSNDILKRANLPKDDSHHLSREKAGYALSFNDWLDLVAVAAFRVGLRFVPLYQLLFHFSLRLTKDMPIRLVTASHHQITFTPAPGCVQIPLSFSNADSGRELNQLFSARYTIP